MKKQILILTFFVAAILAGMNSFGQGGDGIPAQYIKDLSNDLAGCLPPTALDPSCAGDIDALHPQPGLPYTYSVTTTDRGGVEDDIHWFVVNYNELLDATAGSGLDSLINMRNDMTNNAAYIDPGNGTGDYILDATTGVYNIYPNGVGTSTGQTANSIDITWKTFDGLTNVVLLVAYVVDDAGCTDNIEVYRILPVFNFTLDIAPVAEASYSYIDTTTAGRPEECVSPIESAVYEPSATPLTTLGTLNMDYGENYLFFTVTAANFTHSWLPEFTVAYTSTVSDAIEVDWAYHDDADDPNGWHSTVLTGGVYVSESAAGLKDDPVLHSGTNLTAGSETTGADNGTGECIVVRVRIDHGTTENADVTNTVTLKVNGTMYDANAADATATYTNTALDDLHHVDCQQVDFDDVSTYDLTPRPEVTTNTLEGATQAGSGFVPFETKVN